ncbi:GntR family transcriptional regulator [Nonomuraea sp. H19]|uniref:GntR family transcriptional regulator n=1 Tax=Nonomuraea sp. H19 TaxID=3452206 RepID=UPI003F8A2D70
MRRPIADEIRFRKSRSLPIRSNNSVRRTYDLLRSTLPAMGQDAALSERELATAFSASRNTIRLVLRLMAAEGLVTRGPKTGTTVASSTVLAIGELFPLSQWSMGRPLVGKTLEVRVIPAFAAIRERLRLPEGSSVTVVEGLVLDDGVPLAIFVSYAVLTGEQAGELRESELSVISYLEDRLGVRIVRSDTVIAALTSDEQTAQLLGIKPGAVLLSIEDLLRDDTGRPWAVCQIRCRGDRAVFSAPDRRRHAAPED